LYIIYMNFVIQSVDCLDKNKELCSPHALGFKLAPSVDVSLEIRCLKLSRAVTFSSAKYPNTCILQFVWSRAFCVLLKRTAVHVVIAWQ
jgi:hypothetical protein